MQQLYVDTITSVNNRSLVTYSGNNLQIGDTNFPATSFTIPNSITATNVTVGNRLTYQSNIRFNGTLQFGNNNRCTADLGEATDAVIVPRGNDGQRPSGGNLVNGTIRFNTSTNVLEGYVQDGWKPFIEGN